MIGGLVMVALNREYLNAEYHVDHMHEFEVLRSLCTEYLEYVCTCTGIICMYVQYVCTYNVYMNVYIVLYVFMYA